MIHIPDLTIPPVGPYEARQIQPGTSGLSRRSFLRAFGLGGMALGMTVVGWIPKARRAYAVAGTEYTNCHTYQYNGMICTPAVYSASYCGGDKWFKNGCYNVGDGFTRCYRPIAVCEGRNAWRWFEGGTNYRCADGETKLNGDASWTFKICSAANP
jgi:hypothetical protein